MKPAIIALHGFLGQGRDWDDVRAASEIDADWICPDLFSAGSSLAPPRMEGPCWLAGYSFGARLALRWLQDDPDRWCGALLLSVDPGNFQTGEERTKRRASDAAWAAAFASAPWGPLIDRWNEQDVFRGNSFRCRAEKDFDRSKLAAALGGFSVAGQFTDAERLPARLAWMAGEKDTKFCALQTSMRNAGFPGEFLCVPDTGHRLLEDAPAAVAAALDHLVA